MKTKYKIFFAKILSFIITLFISKTLLLASLANLNLPPAVKLFLNSTF